MNFRRKLTAAIHTSMESSATTVKLMFLYTVKPSVAF